MFLATFSQRFVSPVCFTKVLEKCIGGGRLFGTTHFMDKPVMVLFQVNDVASSSLHPTRHEFEHSPALWVKTNTAYFTLVKRWHLVHSGTVVTVPSFHTVSVSRGASTPQGYDA
jgi:hypothetical protein